MFSFFGPWTASTERMRATEKQAILLNARDFFNLPFRQPQQ
jgi:hypothetical protein